MDWFLYDKDLRHERVKDHSESMSLGKGRGSLTKKVIKKIKGEGSQPKK